MFTEWGGVCWYRMSSTFDARAGGLPAPSLRCPDLDGQVHTRSHYGIDNLRRVRSRRCRCAVCESRSRRRSNGPVLLRQSCRRCLRLGSGPGDTGDKVLVGVDGLATSPACLEVPHAHRLVVRAGKEEFAIGRPTDASDPVVVAHQSADTLPGRCVPDLDDLVSASCSYKLTWGSVCAFGCWRLDVSQLSERCIGRNRSKGNGLDYMLVASELDSCLPLAAIPDPARLVVAATADQSAIRRGRDTPHPVGMSL